MRFNIWKVLQTTNLGFAVSIGLAIASFVAPAARADDAQAQALTRMQQAIDRQQSGAVGYGADLLQSAGELSRLGLNGEAMVVLNALVTTPDSTLNRLLGMDLLAELQTPAGALATYEQMMQVYASNASYRSTYSYFYAMSYAKYCTCVRDNGHVNEAVQMLHRFLTAQPDVLPRTIRVNAAFNLVQFAKEAGDLARVVEGVDLLFQADPDFGSPDGSNISLMLDRLDAQDPTKSTEAYRLALSAAFANTAFRGKRQILSVALSLSASQRATGLDSEAIDTIVSALVLLDENRVIWTDVQSEDTDPWWLDATEGKMLTALFGARASNRAAAEVWTSDRLISLMAEDAHTADTARWQLGELKKHFAETDQSIPRHGLGVFSSSDGAIHADQATVLESDFASDAAVPARFVADWPLRRQDGMPAIDCADVIRVYVSTGDACSTWALAPTQLFTIRGPDDPLISDPRVIGVSRMPGAVVRPGVYALVPAPGLRFRLGSPLDPAVLFPAMPECSTLFAPRGAYVFRVAANCDAESGDQTNDALQILQARNETPPRELDANNNGVLDSCDLLDPCAANFNHTGGVTVQDLFDFLSAWFAGCTTATASGPCQFGSADFNDSRLVSVQDIFDFLGAWFAHDPGCN